SFGVTRKSGGAGSPFKSQILRRVGDRLKKVVEPDRIKTHFFCQFSHSCHFLIHLHRIFPVLPFPYTALWPRGTKFQRHNTYLLRSVVVEVSKSSEGGLGLPGHVWVGVTKTVFQDLDHTPTGHVEVLAGVAAVRPAVADEGARESSVDALSCEDVQQLAQVGGLLLLVANIVAVEPDRGSPVVPTHLPAATPAVVSRAAMGSAAELGDCYWLALRDQRADALLVDVGDLLRAVEVDRDDVEWRPVDALERDGGVSDLAAE